MKVNINLLPLHERVAATVDERSWHRWWDTGHIVPVGMFSCIALALVGGMYSVGSASNLLTEARALELLGRSSAASALVLEGGFDSESLGIAVGDGADPGLFSDIAVLHPRLADEAIARLVEADSTAAGDELVRLCLKHSLGCDQLVSRLGAMKSIPPTRVLAYLSPYPDLLRHTAADVEALFGANAIDTLEGLAFDLTAEQSVRRAALFVLGARAYLRSLPILRGALRDRELRGVAVIAVSGYPPEIARRILVEEVETCPNGWRPADVEIGFRDPVAALLVRLGPEHMEPSGSDLMHLVEAAECGNADAVYALARYPSASVDERLASLSHKRISVPDSSILVPYGYVVTRAVEVRTALGLDALPRPSAQSLAAAAGESASSGLEE